MANGNYYNPPYNNFYGSPAMPASGAYGGIQGSYITSPYNYIAGQNYGPATAQNGAQAQPAQSQQNGSFPFIIVTNREAVEKMFVSPNQTVYAMSQNVPEFYIKSVDNVGLANIRYFKFAEFDPAVEAAQMQAQAQAQAQNNAPVGDFVPRSEFNQFVNNVSQELQSVRQSLSNAPLMANVEQPVPTSPAPVKTNTKKAKENVNE